MNSNAELTAESFNEISETHTSTADFKRHEANKTFKHIQTPKKAVNLTQYLSKYGDIINELSEYKINIDDIKFNGKYTYDKEFKTEKKMNKVIINLIIDMFFNCGDYQEKRRLRYKINYLIEKQFKHRFFIIQDQDETGTFYNLKELFKYIKHTIKGKNGDALLKQVKNSKCEYVAKIKAEPLKHNFKCAVCLEDVEYLKILNYNCDCKDLICEECFKKLPYPKKCPLCRKSPYKLNLTIAEDEPAKRRFTIKYNNKIYEEYFNIDNLENETFFYFNEQIEKIDYFKFQLKTDEEILKEIVEDDDKFFNFCCYKADINYLHLHSKTSLNKKPLEILCNHYYEDGDRYEFINNVLCLDDEEDRREFLDEYYNINGVELMNDETEEGIFDCVDFKNEKGNIIFIDYNGGGVDLKNSFGV